MICHVFLHTRAVVKHKSDFQSRGGFSLVIAIASQCCIPKKQEGKCKAHDGPYMMALFTSPLSLDSKWKILTLSPLQPFFEPGTAWHSKEQLQRRLDYTLDIQGCFEINVFDSWKLVSDDSFHQLPYYCGTTFVRQNSESIFSVNGL